MQKHYNQFRNKNSVIANRQEQIHLKDENSFMDLSDDEEEQKGDNDDAQENGLAPSYSSNRFLSRSDKSKGEVMPREEDQISPMLSEEQKMKTQPFSINKEDKI